MISTILLAVAAFTASANAQSLSSACTGALAAVASNPDASTCLSAGSLISLVGASNNSVITPIDSWLTNLCGSPACSNTTLSSVVQNITTGCTAELSGLGLTADAAPLITPVIQQFYPTVRQALCLKDGNTNCITQTLTNIQASTGTLTIANILQIFTNPPSTLPSNVTCTDCVKAVYNLINEAEPNLVSDAAPSLQSECGADFIDGKTPSTISQSASTSTAPASGSSAGTKSAAEKTFNSHGAIAGLAASAMIVISSIFALLP